MLGEAKTLIYAIIRSLNTFYDDKTLCYADMGALEAVDLTCVHCVIGRIPDRGCWAIVDRSGSLAKTQLLATPIDP